MAPTEQTTLRLADWQKDQAAIKAVRTSVFIDEQNIPQDLEWDEHDEHSFHLLTLTAAGEAIATGRLQRDGKIGRIAVLAHWRRQGIASAVVGRLVDLARQQAIATPYLYAQVSALPLYEKHGFVSTGDTFPEAGIPHIKMQLT